MSVIVVNKFCDSIQKVRLFDSRALIVDMDLSVFLKYSFEVYEPGIQNPVLIINENQISTSSEYLRYPDNTVNIKITIKDLETLLPNPYNSDRVREYRIFAIDADGLKVLLQQDCFYVEDNLMGR